MQGFKRTVWCGQVNQDLVDKEVIVNGWVNNRRDHGGVIFIDLRDRTGIVQLVFNPAVCSAAMEKAHTLRNEYVVAAKGVLRKRSKDLVNPKMVTGEYEIGVNNFCLLASSEPLPFQLDEGDRVAEDLRLKYRYLDLRRPEMQKMIKMRHDLILLLRNYFNQHGFYEIETPILSKSTPEGARDYLVPSRLHAGNFYALPQSPQTYKQLLMVACFERYFQIARCFRDEDLRADRQPEFTQLDFEMSFVDESDVYSTVEGFLSEISKIFLQKKVTFPLPKYTYDEIFARFGSDRPDTRFGLEIHDVTTLFESVELTFLRKVFDEFGRVGSLCVKNRTFSRSELDGWTDRVKKEYGASGLLYIRFDECQLPTGPIAKHLSPEFFVEAKEVIQDLEPTDTLFLVADQFHDAWRVLGKLRSEFGKAFGLIDQSKHELFWITDFPMFEWHEEEGRWYAMHHPFTQPQEGWEKLDVNDIRARAYDLVWNGYEVGGGSIRINDAKMQQKIFDILGLDAQTAHRKFGYLLDAQRFGYPPEGGMAFGIERLVMLLAGIDAIRDVIAFPKTQKGSCLMMETPASVEKKQCDELHIKVLE